MGNLSGSTAIRQEAIQCDSSALFTIDEAIEKRRQDLTEYRRLLSHTQISLALTMKTANASFVSESMRLDSEITELEGELQLLEKRTIVLQWTHKVRNLDAELSPIKTRLKRVPSAQQEFRSLQTKTESLRNKITRENRDFKQFLHSISVHCAVPRWGRQLRLRKTLTMSTSNLRERLTKVEFERADIRQKIKDLKCAVDGSQSKLIGIQESASGLTSKARKKRAFLSNIAQEMLNLGKVRRRVSAVKQQIQRDRIKQLKTEDDIQLLQKMIDKLQHRKQHECRKSQRLSEQLITTSAEVYAKVYEPQQKHGRTKERRNRAAIDELRSQIDCVKRRLQERKVRISGRRKLPGSGDGRLSELELGLLDFMQRIKLEKERWITNLHPLSVELLAQSWSSQLDEVLSRS
jgi:chromosome segregation ATPase